MGARLTRRAGRWLGLAWMMVMACPAVVRAQADTGEILGRVTDDTGAILPGVTVTLQSPALLRPLTTVTAESGGYRFPNVPIGTYRVRFEMSGFRTLVQEGIRIEIGFNAEINPKLQVSSVAEEITVKADAPVVDTTQMKTGQTFTREMLENLPTPRDPWAIVAMAPGIAMSGQNVGGSGSGQQPINFAANGGQIANTQYRLDGATVTDMAALGSSSFYFDFDSFEQISVQTGGSDASLPTGGVAITMVTKSGSNRLRGSGRYYLTDGDLQATNIDEELYRQGAGSGNPVKKITDYGYEMGGPILRDRLWFWGSYAIQDVRNGVVGFYRRVPACAPPFATLEAERNCLETDRSKLPAFNAKIDGQFSRAHKFSFQTTGSNKTRNAREASRTRPPETALRQHGLNSLYKFSHNWLPTNRLTVETKVMHIAGGFTLDFQRDEQADIQPLFFDDSDMYARSYQRTIFDRPQTEIRSDANYFQSGLLGGDHALKFGLTWQDTPTSTLTHIGGGAWPTVISTPLGCPTATNGCYVDLYRDGATYNGLRHIGAYVSDAYKRHRLTITAGLRFDRWDDQEKAAAVDENPLAPEWLPAVEFPGIDSGVVYNNWAPRLSVAYDLFGNGKTAVKASTGLYWGQGNDTSGALSPTGTTRVQVPWVDTNGDLIAQRSELDLRRESLRSWSNSWNPDDPAAFTRSTTRVDPDIGNFRTRELLVGVEHELTSNFSVGVNYIRRWYDRFSASIRDGFQTSDYVPLTAVDLCGNSLCPQPSYEYTYYELPFALTNSFEYRNNGFTRDFTGVEIVANRRYGQRWMLNSSLALGRTVGHYDPIAEPQNPTNLAFIDGEDTNAQNSPWIAKVMGMYSFPFQINVAAFLNARDGYFFERFVRSPTRRFGQGTFDALVAPRGEVRHDPLVLLDLKVEKWIRPSRGPEFALSMDVFNSLNSDLVLSRFARQDATTANQVSTVIVARIIRLGVRFKF